MSHKQNLDRDGHEKLRNDDGKLMGNHGKTFGKVGGNPDMLIILSDVK